MLSLVAGFGTSATTANAVGNTLNQFPLIPAVGIGTSLITIVGQCVGAKAYDQAVAYTKKLMLISHLILAVTCSLMIVISPWILKLYHLSPETTELTMQLITLQNVCAIFLYPGSFAISNTLRAASDVRYPMVVAIVSMWVWRVAFSYILGLNLGMGVLGVWIAMVIDWAFFRLLTGVICEPVPEPSQNGLPDVSWVRRKQSFRFLHRQSSFSLL